MEDNVRGRLGSMFPPHEQLTVSSDASQGRPQYRRKSKDGKRSLNIELEGDAEDLTETDFCDTVDETIRLFQALPKDVETLVQSGPLARVKMQQNYNRVNEEHKRLLAALETQREDHKERWTRFHDKQNRLIQDMGQFDHFLEDNEKKRKRAIAATWKIAGRMRKLSVHDKFSRLRKQSSADVLGCLEAELERYQPVVDFTKGVLASARCFVDFQAVIERYHALTDAKRYSVSRLTFRRDVLDRAQRAQNAHMSQHTCHVMHLRQTEVNKEAELTAVRKNNEILARMASDNEEREIRQRIEVALMERSIKNMATLLMEHLPRAHVFYKLPASLENDDLTSVLGSVSSIITDYTKLVAQLREKLSLFPVSEKRKVRKVKKSKAPQDNKPRIHRSIYSL